jgi:hypothetical protein
MLQRTVKKGHPDSFYRCTSRQGAAYRFSAARVAGPTYPAAVMPFADWNFSTALTVAGP